MTLENLVMQILAGGLLGMLGQGARVVAGLKKSSDSASANGQTLADVFDGRALMTSLLIGFVAGAIALLAAGPAGPVTTIDHGLVMAVITSGYAGADFIEAFISRKAAAPRPGMADLPQPPMG
jgi:hypothetical protein